MADLGAVGLDVGLEPVDVPLYEMSASLARDYSVSGVMSDDTGSECARIVRLYDRASGHLIGQTTSDAGDGAYAIEAPSGEVQRVVLDDDAGTLWNDLIDRVIPG